MANVRDWIEHAARFIEALAVEENDRGAPERHTIGGHDVAPRHGPTCGRYRSHDR